MGSFAEVGAVFYEAVPTVNGKEIQYHRISIYEDDSVIDELVSSDGEELTTEFAVLRSDYSEDWDAAWKLFCILEEGHNVSAQTYVCVPTTEEAIHYAHQRAA